MKKEKDGVERRSQLLLPKKGNDQCNNYPHNGFEECTCKTALTISSNPGNLHADQPAKT